MRENAHATENEHDADDEDDQLLVAEALAATEIDAVGQQGEDRQTRPDEDEETADGPGCGVVGFGGPHGNSLVQLVIATRWRVR
jgi:hypothetical protein